MAEAKYSNVTNKIRSHIVMRFHFKVASGSLIVVKNKTDRRFSSHVLNTGKHNPFSIAPNPDYLYMSLDTRGPWPFDLWP